MPSGNLYTSVAFILKKVHHNPIWKKRWQHDTSTAPLPMRYTSMGYTSMRYTSTALYIYEELIQAPSNFLKEHFKQKICKRIFWALFVNKDFL